MRRGTGLIATRLFLPIVVVLTLAAVLILLSSLRGLEFQAARRLPADELTTIRPLMRQVVDEIIHIPMWKVLAFWGTMLALLVLLLSLLPPELRKGVLRSMLRVAAFVVLLVIAIRQNPGLLSLFRSDAAAGAAESAESATIEALPPFEAPTLTPLARFLASLGVVLALGSAAWAGSRWWGTKAGRRSGGSTLEALGEIARRSLDELAGGRDWGNAIIRCYDQMSHVVDRRRGLRRGPAMTAGEFAARLQGAGLPAEPIYKLTRLFEKARYSTHTAGRGEIEEAAACLTLIATFCGEAL